MLPAANGHFQRAIALAPLDSAPHAYYGRWLLGQGRVAEAIVQLETAVSLNPQLAMQRDLLLTAYEQAGNAAAARQLAQDTLSRIPGDATATTVLAGNFKSAPDTSSAKLIDASLSAYRAGKFQQSIAEARQALAIDPHSALAWNNIGAGFGALQQWDLGIAAEQKASNLDPNLQIAQNNLGWFLSQKGRSSTVPNEVRTSTPRASADYINLSLTLNQQGRYQESIAGAQKALAIDPASAEAWNNIAADAEALHDWDEAIAAAGKAIALRPDLQLARNNLAWAQQQKAAAEKH